MVVTVANVWLMWLASGASALPLSPTLALSPLPLSPLSLLLLALALLLLLLLLLRCCRCRCSRSARPVTCGKLCMPWRFPHSACSGLRVARGLVRARAMRGILWERSSGSSPQAESHAQRNLC